MRALFSAGLVAATFLSFPAALVQAQQQVDQRVQAGGLVADLLTDVSETEKKLLALAGAMPEDKFGWRPTEGVRSVGEVFQHVAADNYLIPAFLGAEPPAATGIKAADYATVQAYENRKADKAKIIEDLQASFAHLKRAMSAVTPGTLGNKFTAFGQEFTRQQFVILATTHLHEHLGQAIAYARVNGIVPPWSRNQ